HQPRAELLRTDAVYVALTEDTVTHILALRVAGLDAVDRLRCRALLGAGLLAFRPALLRSSLPLLLALPALRRLLLLTALAPGTVLLVALQAFSLLMLIALPALGVFDVALTLTLDLAGLLALRTFHGASLGSPFDSRLAVLHAGRSSFGR